MEIVYIGFGSNLGNRETNITCALRLLSSEPRLDVLKVSSLYETEPAEGVGGGWFLNGVAKIATTHRPRELLALFQDIEVRLGRSSLDRYGPRTIDLDILLYGDHVLREPYLMIPHPRMDQRSFVLIPLAEIEPTTVHPTRRKSFHELMEQIENPTEVRWVKTIFLAGCFSVEFCS